MSMQEDYDKTIKNKIKNEMSLKSVSEVPTIKKITVNMGIGGNRENKNFVKEAIDDLTKIAGQKVSERKAKVSIANFKLRKGQLAGLTVTLRGKRMWDFYEKLVRIVLPRVRDFQGVSEKSFDGYGNYNLGLSEHTIFPEVDPNKITYNKPLQVTVNTSAQSDELGRKLLSELGMPFRKQQ